MTCIDPTQLPPEARAALDALTESARLHAAAARREMALERVRPVLKHQAIVRIMATGLNPTTGKAFSYTSAEALSESDPEYAQHLAQLREAVAERILASAEQRAAELLAEYLVYAPRRAA
ncbi:MAG TPA: hypothetical protein PLI70_05520 [Gemmatimonadales bacterium]|nr:hypothetical protein [Gemmatimonadales bacterium]HRZ09132.1 hypothetical protein [Gemmatimonadales bacterium]